MGGDPALGYQFIFGPQGAPDDALCSGCGLKAETRIVQQVPLSEGDYTLSWYSAPTSGAGPNPGTDSVTATLEDGGAPQVVVAKKSAVVPGFGFDLTRRSFYTFRVPSTQTVTVAIVPTGGDILGAPHEVLLGGVMLESADVQVSASSALSAAPTRFEGTDDELTRQDGACPDSDGNVFRTRFARGCRRLCANGFDGECAGEDVEEHCYREAQFNLNQRDIESGRLLPNVGFALGNFNYRIESVAVNFVGTGIRDCASADSPTSCNAQGFIPYSLNHCGPYFVRNHMGNDFKAELFTGQIEHARGLGSERYITNPIGSADNELLGPYTRHEFQGRPLDGNFTIRVWDDDTIDFDKIEDVQVVLHYRYWTRFD